MFSCKENKKKNRNNLFSKYIFVIRPHAEKADKIFVFLFFSKFLEILHPQIARFFYTVTLFYLSSTNGKKQLTFCWQPFEPDMVVLAFLIVSSSSVAD